MNRATCPFALSAVLAGVVAAGAICAESPEAPPVESGFQDHVTVQLAQINFIAVDRSGRPVVDLRPEEIEIVDGREKQRVAFLQPYYRRELLPPASPQEAVRPAVGVTAKPTAAVPGAPDAADIGPRRWFLLVFENFLSSSRTRLESIEAARGFVSEKLADSDRVGIVVFDGKLQVLQNYTSDKSKALTAIGNAMQFTEHASEDRTRAVKGLLDAMQHCATAVDASSRPLCAQRVVDEYEDTRIREADSVLKAIGTLLRSSRAVSDPKALVLFTEGFPRDPGQDVRDAAESVMGSEVSRYVTSRRRAELTDKLDDLASAASDAKFSLFTINPGGASRLSSISAAGGRFADNRQNVLQIDPYRTAEINAQQSLFEIAERTGGVALQGADVRRELDRIEALTPAIYTVGYYPTLKALLGDQRSVKLRILRKGVRAEYKRETTAPRAVPPLVGALVVEPEACRGDGRRDVIVRLRLERASLAFTRSKKNVTANFAVFTRFVPEGRVFAIFDDYRLFNVTNTDEEDAAGGISDPTIEQRFTIPCRPMNVLITASDGTTGAIADFSGTVAR